MTNKAGLTCAFIVFAGALVYGTQKAMYGIRNWLDANDPIELDGEEDE